MPHLAGDYCIQQHNSRVIIDREVFNVFWSPKRILKQKNFKNSNFIFQFKQMRQVVSVCMTATTEQAFAPWHCPLLVFLT